MEKQIEKLLRTQNFSKEFCISGSDFVDSEDPNQNTQLKTMDRIRKIQNVPLEKLCLWGITQELMLDIMDTFQNLNLKNLTMIDCEIDSIVAARIVNFIPSLVTLELFNCDIKSDEFVTIIDASARSQSCQNLNLSGIVFEETKTAALIACMEGSQLIYLRLAHCSFDRDKSTSTLAPILNSIANSNARSSQTLSLDNVDFDDGAETAMVSLHKSAHLVALVLHDCTFINNRIITIMKAIQQSSIQSLDIGFSFFDDDIADIMKCVKNSPITKFIFGDNTRTYNDEEIEIIAAVIRSSNLLKLGLNYVQVSNEIFDSIGQSSIVSLDLYLNRIKDKEALKNKVAMICNLLEQCKLKKLSVTLGAIRDVHIRTILSSIKKSELIKFHVYTVYYSDEHIAQEIKETMKEQKLRVLSCNRMKSARH